MSSSGHVNESADAESHDPERCPECDIKKHNANPGCEACSKVLVFYFSPMEECAGRITVDKDGIMRRFAMDGVDVAVKTVPLSTICPRPPPGV